MIGTGGVLPGFLVDDLSLTLKIWFKGFLDGLAVINDDKFFGNEGRD